MKKWTVAPVEVKKEEEPPKQTGWQCIECANKADLLFEGTSYCRKCIEEKIRTGTL